MSFDFIVTSRECLPHMCIGIHIRRRPSCQWHSCLWQVRTSYQNKQIKWKSEYCFCEDYSVKSGDDVDKKSTSILRIWKSYTNFFGVHTVNFLWVYRELFFEGSKVFSDVASCYIGYKLATTPGLSLSGLLYKDPFYQDYHQGTLLADQCDVWSNES